MSRQAFVMLLMAVMVAMVGGGSAADTPLRVLSYTIHHGRGTDGVVNLERIAGVIGGSAADVVMLQEVDDRTDRTGRIDQTAEIARFTGLHAEFGRQIDFILTCGSPCRGRTRWENQPSSTTGSRRIRSIAVRRNPTGR